MCQCKVAFATVDIWGIGTAFGLSSWSASSSSAQATRRQGPSSSGPGASSCCGPRLAASVVCGAQDYLATTSTGHAHVASNVKFHFGRPAAARRWRPGWPAGAAAAGTWHQQRPQCPRPRPSSQPGHRHPQQRGSRVTCTIIRTSPQDRGSELSTQRSTSTWFLDPFARRTTRRLGARRIELDVRILA